MASEVQDRIVFLNQTKVLLKMIEKKEGSSPNAKEEASMPRAFAQREVGKSRKRQRIRFGHPIATIFGDDGQNEMDKNFVQETFKSRKVIAEVPVESSNLIQNPNINEIEIESKSCINCKVLNSCRWQRDGKGHWVCNACHLYERRTGRLRPPSNSSKTFKLAGSVKTEDTARPDTNDCRELERKHDDPYPSKNTAMDVLDSEKAAECDDQVQNSIQLHGAEPEVQGDKALGTKSQGVNWVHEQSGTSPTSTVYDEEDEDEDQDQDQGGGINNAEEDLAAITVHLEDFVANQLQAVSILQGERDFSG